jgi:hypothetical protein
MRALLLAIALLFSFAAVVMTAATIPRGLFVAGFVVVAVVLVVLTGVHVRRATAGEVCSSRARSVARTRKPADADGTPSLGVPAPAGFGARERRVA